MQLTYLRIHNFKSIRSMEIRDIERALILVGKNNTGKTSVLDAICAVCGCYEIQDRDFNENRQAIRIDACFSIEEEDLHLFHHMGIVSQYRRYDVWRRVFSERLPSFQNGELSFTFHVNQDGKVRYEDLYRKNNPYIHMVMPRIYRINAERELNQLQNDLLMFQEDEELRRLRSGSCIFERAKKCNHCFQCIGLINKKKPEELSAFETARLLEFKIYQMNLSGFSGKVNENFFKNGGYEEIQYTLSCDADQLFTVEVTAHNRQRGTVKPVELMGKGMRSIYMLSLLETYISEQGRIPSIIVVEDLGEASVVAKNLGYRNRIVTMDGQVINAGGSFTGGSTARSVGVFSRKQELDELRAKVLKLDERRAAAEKEAAARKAEVDNLTAQLAGAESEGMTAAAARLKAEMELDQLNTALEEGKNAAAHRGQEIAALEQQLRENTAAAAQAENARKQAEAEIETHRKELESLGASTSDVTRQREEASQKLSDNRMQKLRTEKDLSLHEAALETLKGRSGEAEARVRELQANVAAAKERIAANELRANEIKRASEENKQKITAAEETIRKANAERMEKEAAVTRLTQENRTLTDERERMSGEMARLAERKTAAETELNTTASKLWEEYQLTEAEAEKLCVPFANVADLRRQVAEVRGKIRALGNVNVGAIEEYKEVKERYDFMKAQVTDVEKSRAELNRMIAELCSEMQEMFTASFKEINRNFGAIFRELFGGGSARLYLSDENDVLNSGIEIQVSPPGKVIKNLSALSGGEQALVAISIYFAILAVNPSPFCILDEIEAALDDVNVTRYAQYLRRMTERTQFIVITHRRGTMEAADVLYGVTMQEDGVSKILRLDLENVSADLIS